VGVGWGVEGVVGKLEVGVVHLRGLGAEVGCTVWWEKRSPEWF
jgi:hypothetical protein